MALPPPDGDLPPEAHPTGVTEDTVLDPALIRGDDLPGGTQRDAQAGGRLAAPDDSMSASAGGITDSGSGSATRLQSLNPSLLHDLQRFESAHAPGYGLDVLEVLAAALRHGRALLLQLQLDYRVIPLLVQPLEGRLASSLTLDQWTALRLPDLRVLRVEPAPTPTAAGLPPGLPYDAPLAPLLWEVALRGAREALLPEIGGVAAYRVAPSANLSSLNLGGSLAAAVLRLRETPASLREIAGWPGFDGSRAARMLNGLYLQAALMITRTHPSAINGR